MDEIRNVVEEWLDSQIKLWEQIDALTTKNESLMEWDDHAHVIQFLSSSTPLNKHRKEIHLYQGIEDLARVLGAPLRCDDDWDEKEYKYRYFIQYRNYIIFQISNKVLEVENEC